MKLLSSFAAAYLAVQAAGAAVSPRPNGYTITEHPDLEQRAQLQNIVSASLAWKGTIARAGTYSALSRRSLGTTNRST